ncbi:hypothetical protein A9264_05465 [Vibrio sp. UCD-FRSSP16_10]|nr:hypothetical protein A9260_07705 [Vibrio sp. UCD-FRSSP16_30]OBT17094.1 hypothetical protein A9264_05465 [Vibrio sp. UCD-FRSSP16_10]
MSDCDESGFFDSLLNALQIIALLYIFAYVLQGLITALITMTIWVFKAAYYVISAILISIDHFIYDKKDKQNVVSIDSAEHPRQSRIFVNPKRRNLTTIVLMSIAIVGGAVAGVINAKHESDKLQSKVTQDSLPSSSKVDSTSIQAKSGSFAQVTAQNLNVRVTPSIHSQITFKISHLSLVNVLRQKSGWSYISVNEKQGWVSSAYLTSNDSYAFDSQHSSVVTSSAIVEVDKGNVRNKPSMQGQVIFQIKRGGKVDVLKQKGSWSYIRIYGYHGWVATRLLNIKL